MKLNRHLLITLLLAGTAGVASAQATANWTGFYVGLNAGYGSGKSDVTTATTYSGTGYFASTSVTSLNASGMDSVSPKGFTGGLTFGYNAQSGTTVYGFEMDANSFNLKGDRSITHVYPGFEPTGYTIKQTTKTDYLTTLRGRVGYANGQGLWFVTAGAAMTSIKIEDDFTDTYAAAAESVSKSKSKTGWTIGVGYEFAMPNNWSFKAEILYLDFGKVTADGSTLTTDNSIVPPLVVGSTSAAIAPPAAALVSWPTNPFTHSATLKGEVVRIGFNYRF